MTKSGLSLRDRVLLAFALIATVALGIAAVVVVSTHSYLINQLDQRLTTFAGTQPDWDDLAQHEGSGDGTSAKPDETGTPAGDRPSDVLRGYVDANGDLQVVYAPNVGDEQGVPVIAAEDLPQHGSATFSAPSSQGDAGFRVYARATGATTDITALPLDEVHSTTQRLIAIEAVGILMLLLGLGLVAAWVIRLGVNPMRRLVDASTRIAEGDLTVRLEGVGAGSESADLAASLNRMIERLTSALKERERSEARLRVFVADASHELRTPLTTILGYAELYRRGALGTKADGAEAWERTEAEASRMRRLVIDMLELAKYDAEPVLARVDVNLTSLCAEVAGDAEASHADASVTVVGDSQTVVGDPDKLRQAVINVVMNALVHGGNSVVITISGDENYGSIAVSDNGQGMPPDIAERAAERFVRGDHARSRAHGGAGLGLSITAAIVEAHNGHIAVASEEGNGTTVTITLPRG